MVPQNLTDIWLNPGIRDVLWAKNWLHVTEDVTMWGTIFFVELTWELKGSINLHEVKTGRSPGCPVAGLWHSLGLQRPQGETNTHLSLLLCSFPFSFLLFYSQSLWGPLSVCHVPCPSPWPLRRPNMGHLFIHKRGGGEASSSPLVLCGTASLQGHLELFGGQHINQRILAPAGQSYMVIYKQNHYCHHYNISLVPFRFPLLQNINKSCRNLQDWNLVCPLAYHFVPLCSLSQNHWFQWRWNSVITGFNLCTRIMFLKQRGQQLIVPGLGVM